MATATRTTRKAPAMTASEARHFNRLSIASYAQIAEQLACECEPYADTFTYGRWRAQGYQVQRGQKGIKFSSYIVSTRASSDDDSEDGELRDMSGRRLIPRTLVVFCRHQVEAVQA